MRKFKGQLCLLAAAFIWGSAFIFQKMGMDHIGPFTFGVFRFGLGSLALLPVIFIISVVNKRRATPKQITPFRDRTLLMGALLCGISNYTAGSLQQVGIVYTTAGKAGFITSLDIVIVPILLLFMRKKVSRTTWLGVAMAIVGLALLCLTDDLSLHLGDALVMGCAVAYSFQILLIDHYADKVDNLRLSCLMYMVAGILSGITAVFTETINVQSILDCAIPILYVAILEVSVAFTLQIIGQRYTPPAIATIIMSLESVFAVICGTLFLHETMTGRELMGCIVMFAAFIISQISDFKKES